MRQRMHPISLSLQSLHRTYTEESRLQRNKDGNKDWRTNHQHLVIRRRSHATSRISQRTEKSPEKIQVEKHGCRTKFEHEQNVRDDKSNIERIQIR